MKIKSIKLSRLKGDLSSEADILFNNYQLVFNVTQEMISTLVGESWLDGLTIPRYNQYLGTEYGQTYFSWRQGLFEKLEQLVNLVSRNFNVLGLLVPPNYEELRLVKLWIPKNSLFGTTYVNKVNNDFYAIETRVNDFYKIMYDAKLIVK